MCYESDAPSSCDECRHASIGDGFWPDECELAGIELPSMDYDLARPEWCPLCPDGE